ARVGARLTDLLGRFEATNAPSDRRVARIALGWGNIAPDRAEAFWRDRGPPPPGPAPDDDILGARCLLLAEGDGRADGPESSSGGSILLLEASTEGLLAASLARFGEGFVAAGGGAESAAATHAGLLVSRLAGGRVGG